MLNNTTHKRKIAIPLWIGSWLWQVLCIALCTAVVVGLMYTGWTRRVDKMWTKTSRELQLRISESIDDSVRFVRLAANLLVQMDQQISNASIPDSNYDSEVMHHLFHALETNIYRFNSLGVIRDASEMRTDGKFSWQVARGFGCPEYIWAYCDPSTYPNFLGYCIAKHGSAEGSDEIDFSNPVYNGTDWGLKPLEKQMLQQQSPTNVYLPIFPLLGQFMFTYERIVRDPRAPAGSRPYALVFAEASLEALSNFMLSLNIMDRRGFAYIVERETGLLVAANSVNATLTTKDNGATYDRVSALNSTVRAIRETYPTAAKQLSDKTSLKAGSWRISVDRYYDEAKADGVDWLIIVAVPNSVVFEGVNKARATAVGIAVLIAVLAAGASFAWHFFLVRKRLGRVGERMRGLKRTIESDGAMISLINHNDAGVPTASSVDTISEMNLENDVPAFGFSEINDVETSCAELENGIAAKKKAASSRGKPV